MAKEIDEQREPPRLDKFAAILYPKGQAPTAAQAPGKAPMTVVRLLVILDRSYSMAGYEHRVRSGLKQFLGGLDPATPYWITLVQFDHEIELLCTAEPIASLIAQCAIERYQPRGDTALWDAIGAALERETSRSEPVLCLIVSDGEDNRSAQLDSREAARRIGERRNQWPNWKFLWLNLSGARNFHANDLGIECLDFSREDMPRVLTELAGKLSRAVRRMQLEGARRIPDLLRLP